MGNEQQTSAPYSGDVLHVHDDRLLQAVEFGTNTTAVVGDFFDYGTTGLAGYSAAIDARLGMLQVRIDTGPGDPADSFPRGQSFALPSFERWTFFPLGNGDFRRVCVVYIHQLFRTFNHANPGNGGPDTPNTAAGFLLGDERLIGTVGAGNREAADFRIGAPEFSPFPAVIPDVPFIVGGWDGNNLSTTASGNNGGAERWWRVLCNGEDDVIEINVSGSRDGVSWQNCGLTEVQASGPLDVFRIGLYATGEEVESFTDWVRVYGVDPAVDPAASPNSFVYPDTGGRLFVP